MLFYMDMYSDLTVIWRDVCGGRTATRYSSHGKQVKNNMHAQIQICSLSHTFAHQSHLFQAGPICRLRDISQHPFPSFSMHTHTYWPDWRVLGRKGESQKKRPVEVRRVLCGALGQYLKRTAGLLLLVLPGLYCSLLVTEETFRSVMTPLCLLSMGSVYALMYVNVHVYPDSNAF